MKMPTKKGTDLVGGADYCSTPGTYHALIDNVRAGLSIKDEVQDGATLELTIMDGDVAGQKNKKVNVTLWYLREDKSLEDQDISVRRLNNFALAANLLLPTQLGMDEVEVNEEDATGHQIVIKLAHARKKNAVGEYVDDEKFLQISYGDIWHVDDPFVAKIPKNQDAIKTIDPKYRHSADWFAFKKKIGEKATAGTASEYDEI